MYCFRVYIDFNRGALMFPIQQSIDIIELMKESPEFKIRLFTVCLQYIQNREELSSEKDRVQNIISKMPDMKDIETLNDNQKLILNLFLDAFAGYRDSYVQLIVFPEYIKFKEEKFDITDFLIKMIPSITLFNDKLTPEGVKSKVNVYLLREFGKCCPRMPKQFIKKWSNLAADKMQQRIKRKQEQKNLQQQQTVKKVEPQKKQISEEEEQESNSESEPAPKPKEKSVQQRDREARQQREREKRQKERIEQQRMQKQREQNRRITERRSRETNQKQSDQRQKQHSRSLKAKAIEKYLELKGIICDKGKTREVGEYLAAKLDQFLKTTLQQMYDIACLKNKKNPKFGNELGYFSQDNNRIQHQQQFYFHPNTKICTLSYKHKHQIYSSLRLAEILKEDKLRADLENQTNKGDKKIDKKIQNYMLKPRPKETDSMLIPFRQQQDGYRQQTITISLQHVIYYLQNHPWLRNSLLLFNVYHRF